MRTGEDVTVRNDGSRWEASPAPTGAGEAGGWAGGERPSLRNPPFEWRVALVGAALGLPGMLVGLLACALLGGPEQVPSALTAGGVIGAVLGAVLEAS